MSDVDGFRAVLHEWARRQLERTFHVGPFEITEVRLDHYPGFGSADTPDGDYTDVVIRFRHDGTNCRLPEYLAGKSCHDELWSPMRSQTTADMLNELLAIADEA